MIVSIDELRPGVMRIALDGRLDLAGAETAEARFNAALSSQPRVLIVDLGKLTFMASVGLRLLMTNGKSLAKAGASMLLINPDDTARAILKSTAIDKILPVFNSLDAALDTLP